MKKIYLTIFIFLFLSASQAIIAQSQFVLWYTQPAEYFEEAFLMGNGTMGATIYGGVNQEKILLNEATLWSGEPVDSSDLNPDAWESGSVSGIRTRAGVEIVALAWENSAGTTQVSVCCKACIDGKITFVFGGEKKVVKLKKGEIEEFTF